MFWGALEFCLSAARHIISDHLKMKISHEIDALRAIIKKDAESDPAFAELSVALTRASTEVHAALSEAESWFSRPEMREATYDFNLSESLDVALDSALKLNRTLTPAITREVSGH